ncbi:S41 family peptidase [Nisaea sp.]|uniref:S41 family peptidase n=1 Tax=Nisaea sp. TaxID=2024842 RepID=UPI0032EB41D7
MYNRDDAAGMFSAGFDGITSFYIEETDLPSLAVAGLSGLKNLDNAMTVADQGDLIVVGRNGREVAAFSVPDADDVARWSMLMAAAVDSGRQVSGSLREASPEALYDAIFKGALQDLDRFSRYTTSAEASRSRAHRRGYSGIGILLFENHGTIYIEEIYKDGPAADSGLQVGDSIVAIDGNSVAGLDAVAVSDLLRGPSGSKVRVTTSSDETHRTTGITRAPVIEQTVFPSHKGNSAYFEIRSFNEDTASSLSRRVGEAAAQIGPSLNGIILDLRNNRGGVLRDAIAIADLFIRDGRILLTKGRHARSVKEFTAHKPDIAAGIPLIVLINHDSASASEVVAGALQDSGRAVLIGGRTYGKGTVQMIVRLPNEGELIITWARMYTPSGYPIGPLGVYPTICTDEIEDPSLQHVAGTARTAAVRARELLRLRRIAQDLDDSIQEALLGRCGDRTPAADGADLDLALALKLLGERSLFDRAFEASLVASQWPSKAQ